MAKVKYYGIFDRIAGRYMSPFAQHNDGIACRAVTEVLIDKTQNLSKTPGDFALYFLTEFDDESGEFKSDFAPKHVMNVIDLLPKGGES